MFRCADGHLSAEIMQKIDIFADSETASLCNIHVKYPTNGVARFSRHFANVSGLKGATNHFVGEHTRKL